MAAAVAAKWWWQLAVLASTKRSNSGERCTFNHPSDDWLAFSHRNEFFVASARHKWRGMSVHLAQRSVARSQCQRCNMSFACIQIHTHSAYKHIPACIELKYWKKWHRRQREEATRTIADKVDARARASAIVFAVCTRVIEMELTDCSVIYKCVVLRSHCAQY